MQYAHSFTFLSWRSNISPRCHLTPIKDKCERLKCVKKIPPLWFRYDSVSVCTRSPMCSALEVWLRETGTVRRTRALRERAKKHPLRAFELWPFDYHTMTIWTIGAMGTLIDKKYPSLWRNASLLQIKKYLVPCSSNHWYIHAQMHKSAYIQTYYLYIRIQSTDTY